MVPAMPFPMHPKMDEDQAMAFSDEEERRHIRKVQNAFQYYRRYAFLSLDKKENYIRSLSEEDQGLLSKYRQHLSLVRVCINRNQSVIREIQRDRVLYPTNDGYESDTSTDYKNDEAPTNVRHGDMDQAQSTLQLIARDWSAECAFEREQSYKPIIDSIVDYYKPSEYKPNEIKILVPGAGLGRLTYELACRGYACEGNEFSYFMLIASNFVLNLCDVENKYILYPWIHQYVNNMRREDQTAFVRFPDVCPVKNPPIGNIEMAAGDFLEAYKTPDSYNCVATCFFIDCANNVIDFIRTIYNILVPGGIWVNLGPLLYHYSDVSGQNSIEPTYEDLRIIIESIGFDILTSRTQIRTQYAQNPLSMKQSEYHSLFWVCRKPPNNFEQHQQRNQQEPTDLIMNQSDIDDKSKSKSESGTESDDNSNAQTEAKSESDDTDDADLIEP